MAPKTKRNYERKNFGSSLQKTMDKGKSYADNNLLLKPFLLYPLGATINLYSMASSKNQDNFRQIDYVLFRGLDIGCSTQHNRSFTTHCFRMSNDVEYQVADSLYSRPSECHS